MGQNHKSGTVHIVCSLMLGILLELHHVAVYLQRATPLARNLVDVMLANVRSGIFDVLKAVGWS